MGSRLRIKTLGRFIVQLDGEPIHDLASRKAEALLLYLVLNPRTHPREVLADLLWDDRSQRQALANLRSVLSSLRRTVGPFVHITRTTARVVPDADVWVDATQLEAAVACVQAEEGVGSAVQAQRLDETLALYEGDFLAGFFLPEASGFEMWAAAERERLHRLAVDGARRLGDWYLAQGENAAAIATATRLVGMDPLVEAGQQQLMEALARSGQRVEALRQYEQFAHLLAEELGVEPPPVLRKAYERIGAGEAVGGAWRRPRHNLPPQSTPFIGREQELTELVHLLCETKGGFVSIVAPGGMGKTRLALALAERYVSASAANGSFADGVYFVDLAPLDEPPAIVGAIARATGYRPSGDGRDARQQLLDFLREKQLLLVLDNFEHLLPGAALVTEIRQVAPGVAIVATSRQRLAQPGERLFLLEGMEVPDWATPEEALAYAAMQLFLDSARRAQPRFKLTKDNVVAVAEICHLVGGMPLGIVLAASWLVVLSVEEVAAEIAQGLSILEAVGGEVEARHRSMRAVFDQTWRLLAEDERQVFAQVSVFRGGFTREAVQAVTGAELRTLLGLTNKALIRRRSSTGRFQVHELLRQYAAERLEGMRRSAEVRDAHAAYFAQFVAERDLDEGKYSQKEIGDSIDADFENIRAAWLWSLAQGHYDLLLKMVVSLYSFCWTRSRRIAEVMDLFEDTLAALDSEEVARDARQVMGRLLAGLAFLLFQLRGPGDRQERLARRSLQIAQRAGDGLGQALAKSAVVWVSLDRDGCLREELKMIDESSETLLKLNLLSLAAGHCQWLKAHILLKAGGTLQEHQAVLEKSLSMARGAGNRLVESMALGDLSSSFLLQGNYAQAMAYSQESVSIALEQDLPPLHGTSIARTCVLMGEYDKARSWYQKWLALFRSDGDENLSRYTLIELARLAALEGRRQEAVSLLEEGCRLYPDLAQGTAYEGMQGFLAYRCGDYEEAIRWYERILKKGSSIGGIARAAVMQGLAQVKMGQVGAGRQSLRRALQKVYEVGHRVDYPRAIYGFAEVARILSHEEEAVQLAALIRDHTVTPYEVNEYAIDLLQALEADLPPDVYETAYAQGETLDLDTVVEQLLDEALGPWSALYG